MKRLPRRVSEKTGAPDPIFLKSAPRQDGIGLLLSASRTDRGPLRQLATDEISKTVWLGILELSERVFWPKILPSGLLDNRAAKDLAAMATAAADILEELAFFDSPEISRQVEFAGMAKNRWPVNLSLGAKKNVTGAILEGAEKAKAYLVKIRLGEAPAHALKHMGRDTSIFNRAAQLLLQGLLDLKVRAIPTKMTSWFRDLYALESPMTGANVGKWWSVGKRWMDEQWKKNPDLFKPLIEACRIEGKKLAGEAPLYGSEIRAHIIDLRLKRSFLALVRPSVL